MKHTHTYILVFVAALALSTTIARADVTGINMDFEDYQLGELLGQDAWEPNNNWSGAFEIINRVGPDGNMTKCLATTPTLTINWPRAHFNIATDRLTRYGWPTTGKFRVSFDFLFERAIPVTLHFFAQTGNGMRFDQWQAFQVNYTTAGNGRYRVVPGYFNLVTDVATSIQNGTASWHHTDIDLDFATSTFSTSVDDKVLGTGTEFTKDASNMISFGQFVLQIPTNGSQTPVDYDGFYLDNLRIYRTDLDPREIAITTIIFR